MHLGKQLGELVSQFWASAQGSMRLRWGRGVVEVIEVKEGQATPRLVTQQGGGLARAGNLISPTRRRSSRAGALPGSRQPLSASWPELRWAGLGLQRAGVGFRPLGR